MTLFVSILAALFTFELGKFQKIGVVRSSCITGLIASLISNISGDPHYLFLAFGASFVGMCSFEKFSRWHVLVAAYIYSLLFNSLVPNLKGMGGALGFSAFLSVSVVFLLCRLYRHAHRRFLRNQE